MTDSNIVSIVGKEIADALDSWDLEFINITGQILITKIRPRRKFVSRPMMRRMEEVIGAVELIDLNERTISFDTKAKTPQNKEKITDNMKQESEQNQALWRKYE